MTKKEKRTFIHNFMASVEGFLIGKLDKVPDTWDGRELREWIAGQFEYERTLNKREDRRRIRNCRNEIICRGL